MQLQLSADVEVVFARGTVTPEQQKKVPLTQTQDEDRAVDGDLSMQFKSLSFPNMKPVRSFLSSILLFPEDTVLRYRYETRYRTATVMEEDALNKPTAAGEPPVKSGCSHVDIQSSHWNHS